MLAEPFILREKGSASRDVFESRLKEKKSVSLSQFKVCCELGSPAAIKEAVIAGLGVSVISSRAVRREISARLLFEVPIDGCRIEQQFYLINRKKMDLRPHHKIFIEFLNHYPT